MPTETGQMVGIAFEAIRQCHQDVGRLIADFDGYMAKSGLTRMSDQDAVTWGMSRAAYAPYWMAKQLYRLYHDVEKTPNVVEGINIRFFSDDGSLNEPRLIVGRIVYDVPLTKTVQKIAQTWDLDDGYHKWCNATPDDFGKPVTCSNADNGRLLRMCAIALDLYSIQSLEDVKSLLSQVRIHQGVT